MPPVNVMTIDSTVAKIGRSMKNREIMAVAGVAWASRAGPVTSFLRADGDVPYRSGRGDGSSSAPCGLDGGRAAAPSGSAAASPSARRVRWRFALGDAAASASLLRPDLHPRADLLQAADDDPVVRLEPSFDHAQAVVLQRPVVTRRYWTLFSASTT